MKRREWFELRQKLEEQGCHIQIGGSGHYKVYQGKRLLTVLPATTSDWRAIRNKKSELKRKGILV